MGLGVWGVGMHPAHLSCPRLMAHRGPELIVLLPGLGKVYLGTPWPNLAKKQL